MAGPTRPRAFSAATLAYFSILGFIVAFLVMKLHLGRQIADEDEALGARRALVDKVLEVPADKLGHLSTSLLESAKQGLLSLRLDDLKGVDELVAWGRAKLADEQPDDAWAAFQRALAISPKNGDDDVLRAYESFIFASLYRDPPQGFAAAIRAAEEYLGRPKHQESAAVYAWLACAYGQKARWGTRPDQTPPLTDAERNDLRNKAFEAARKAITLDPSWRPQLGATMTANDDNTDNDLSVFRPDAEFAKLLGVG